MTFEELDNKVASELSPLMEKSAVFILILPVSKEKVDAKVCIELGMALFYDKPIIVVARRGIEIPKTISRIACQVIEDCDFENMSEVKDAITKALVHHGVINAN